MSKKEKRSNKENAALQNDALSTENTENSVVQNEADAQQTDTASGSGAKISFFDADETRSGVYIDKAEAEAFLEAQRKKKLRNKIITASVSVAVLLLCAFIVFNVVFSGNSGLIQFSDYALTKNNAMPTGTAVDNNSGMTVFGAVSTANGGKIELSYSPSDSLLLIAVKDSSGNILEQYRSWPEPNADEINPDTALNEYPKYRVNHDIVSSLIRVGYTLSNFDGGQDFGINQVKHTEEIKTIENGFRIKYYLEDVMASFVVEFFLDASGNLVVNIPKNELVEVKAGKGEEPDRLPRMASVTCLPFFYAARQGDDGYFVIPDGSGALTYFDVSRIAKYDEYSKRVYGYDSTFDTFTYPNTSNESVVMPAYGIVKKNSMVTCFAEEGEASASIVMGIPGVRNLSLYYINYRFNWRDFYTSKVTNGGETYTFLETVSGTGDFRQKYCFFIEDEGKNFTYVDVAVQTREFLLDKWKADTEIYSYLTNENINDIDAEDDKAKLMHIKIFLASEGDSSVSFLSNMKTVTTFEDAKNIISDMRNAGASNIRYSLLGWQNNGYYGNIMRKYGIEGSTGGKSGLKKLNAWAEENGVELSLDQNMLLIYGSPKGASLRDAVVKNAGTEYLRYKLVNNAGVFMSGSNCYYMSPLYYHNKMLSKDIKGLSKLNVKNVDLQQLGDMLYTDYNKENALLRQQALEYYREWIAEYKKAFGEVSVYYGFEYAASVADNILDIPDDTSQLFVIDEAIPFIQIVYHGVVDYYCETINRTSDNAYATLKAVEYGAFLSYEVTEQPTDELKYTLYNSLFKSQYSSLRAEILNGYAIADKVLAKVESSLITNHYCVDGARSGNVYCTEYSNGVKVYVNYGDSAYDIDGGSIPAEGVAISSSAGFDTITVND